MKSVDKAMRAVAVLLLVAAALSACGENGSNRNESAAATDDVPTTCRKFNELDRRTKDNPDAAASGLRRIADQATPSTGEILRQLADALEKKDAMAAIGSGFTLKAQCESAGVPLNP